MYAYGLGDGAMKLRQFLVNYTEQNQLVDIWEWDRKDKRYFYCGVKPACDVVEAKWGGMKLMNVYTDGKYNIISVKVK